MAFKYVIAPMLALALTLPAAAAAQDAGQQQPRDQQRAEQPGQDRMDRAHEQNDGVIRADRLIGQVVRDQQQQRLGRISDLAFDLNDNRVVYVVVNRGGLWGVGGEDVAVQWHHVRVDRDAGEVRIDAQHLQQARPIDLRQDWPRGTDLFGMRSDEGARQHGTEQRPGAGTGEARTEPRAGQDPRGVAGQGTDATRGVGAQARHGVVPMSNLLGMDVRNQQRENLGRVDDVALSHDGSVSYAVIAHGGFLGIGENYVAVPFDRLNIDRQQQLAHLDVARGDLDGAQTFDHREEWPAEVDWPFGNDRR